MPTPFFTPIWLTSKRKTYAKSWSVSCRGSFIIIFIDLKTQLKWNQKESIGKKNARNAALTKLRWVPWSPWTWERLLDITVNFLLIATGQGQDSWDILNHFFYGAFPYIWFSGSNMITSTILRSQVFFSSQGSLAGSFPGRDRWSRWLHSSWPVGEGSHPALHGLGGW